MRGPSHSWTLPARLHEMSPQCRPRRRRHSARVIPPSMSMMELCMNPAREEHR